ncbi:MAG: hypothetical protein NC928_04520 [Candidatus Omnitrophica bacterium]|nr:hypothetical protein [Candidatus Omnitrophota bacterium]
MKKKEIFFISLVALLIEFFIHQVFLLVQLPSNLSRRNVCLIDEATTAFSSDLTVNIVSVGRSTAGIFNLLENRIEHTPGPLRT